MSLDHIAVIVSKEENLEFYRKLGFAETKRIKRSHDTVVFMANDGVTLEIFIDPMHPKRVTGPEAMGLRHLAFVVNRIEDLDVEIEDIRINFFGKRFTFTKDMDGQPIELIED